MKNHIKKGMSGLLAFLMCFTVLLSAGVTPAFAASETCTTYSVGFPRDGDANQVYSNEVWGHPSLTHKKSAILDHLRKHHTGMRNAVHSAELERLFSLDDRAVRRKISALRKEGYPICSGDMGYYYAENQKDINSTVGRLNDLMTGVSDARTGLLFSRFPEPVMTVRVTVMMNGGEL